MTGELATARGVLEAALEGAGIAVARPGQPLAVPGAFVRPGDPYLVRSSIGPAGQRTPRLSCVLVAGKVDSLAAIAELETLTELAILALDGLQGWSTPAISRVGQADVFGLPYLVADLSLEGPPLMIAAPPP